MSDAILGHKHERVIFVLDLCVLNASVYARYEFLDTRNLLTGSIKCTNQENYSFGDKSEHHLKPR